MTSRPLYDGCLRLLFSGLDHNITPVPPRLGLPHLLLGPLLTQLLLPPLSFREFPGHKVLPLQFLLLFGLLAREFPLHREEHRTQFGQPVRVDSRHAIHVLFGGHDEFVIDDVFGDVAEGEEGAGWVELAGHACTEVYVVAHAFYFGGVYEVARADGFTH